MLKSSEKSPGIYFTDEADRLRDNGGGLAMIGVAGLVLGVCVTYSVVIEKNPAAYKAIAGTAAVIINSGSVFAIRHSLNLWEKANILEEQPPDQQSPLD